MREIPTTLQGDLCVSELVHEAAERSLEITLPPQNDRSSNIPFGSGEVSIHEVQPGLRCELSALTCHTDHDFDILGGPLINCSLILDGSMEAITIDHLGEIDSPLNRARLIGLGEPTRWKRRIRAGQSYKAFGFSLEPKFFERFASAVEDEQLSVFNTFRSGQRARVMPASQRLTGLGLSAFTHPYSGSLAILFHESTTLQFVLEISKLLREETQLSQEIGRKHYDRLMHARTLIDENLISPPKTLDLARQVGGNINTLQAHFKLAFGTTVFGYIRTRRLEMARALITEHKLGSAQAGYRVGFSNPAAFTAAYRKFFGHPPSKAPQYIHQDPSY